MGKKLRLAYLSTRIDSRETHLNNTSQGVEATLIPLKDIKSEFRDIAARAAFVLSRDVAGVELIMVGKGYKPVLMKLTLVHK